MHLLQTKNITMKFGGLTALSNVNITIDRNEIIGLIGPNGAGKTTAFNSITGVYKPSAGSIYFNGDDITHKKPHEITRLGIARTFQNIRLFKNLSVLDNVFIGQHLRLNSSMLQAVLRTKGYRNQEERMRHYSIELLKAVKLDDVLNEQADSLPYGKQRRLEIARALSTKPTLLLLDEPAAGMNPSESKELMHFIHEIRDRFSVTILMIEHTMQVVMGICQRIYVLDYGITIAEGNPYEIQNNPKVIEAYLGV